MLLEATCLFSGNSVQILISAAAYAASHVSEEGFGELFVLGTILGCCHSVSKFDLLVPTISHSLYNMCIFIAILLTATVG